MRVRPIKILLTCEHGGNQVPSAYRQLFVPHRELLRTHRGWDPGTKQLGELWHSKCGHELHASTVTRLLVDLNRSSHHPRVFSEITRVLPKNDRLDLLHAYHTPHREQIFTAIATAIRAGQRVLHLGIHSFTPVLDGQVRSADVGLLYDPSRPWELALCRLWRQKLISATLRPRVRLNYPYRGTSDGLTTSLRKQFSEDQYAGIELEVNQQFPLGGGKAWLRMQSTCISSFAEVVAAEEEG
jgi:predicted N-formylglutamate amidohydrolase